MGPVVQVRAVLLAFLAYSCLWQDTGAQGCPSSWVRIGKYCYGYMDHPRTWASAEKKCRTFGNGAHLASIHSLDEMRVLAKHLVHSFNPPGHLWIGLYRPYTSSIHEWKWTDGTPTNYLSWNTFEPNNLFFKEYCVELYTYDLMYWNDTDCTWKYSFVCKKPA